MPLNTRYAAKNRGRPRGAGEEEMTPTEMIARLRRSLKSDGMPILTHETAELIGMLNRLEKLEAVAEAATRLVESAITQADILENGDIVPTRCAVDPNTFDGLQDALAALEDK